MLCTKGLGTVSINVSPYLHTQGKGKMDALKILKLKT